MISKWVVYRAAWIFGCADAGMTPLQIKAMEETLAECFAEELPVEEAVRRTISVQAEAG